MALTLLAMLFIPELTTSMRTLALMVLLVNIFASLQDVSVDALAIDLLPAKERGVANGFMYGSNYAGSFIGGAILGQCHFATMAFRRPLATQVSILLAIAAFPLFCANAQATCYSRGLAQKTRPTPMPLRCTTLFVASTLRTADQGVFAAIDSTGRIAWRFCHW